MTEQLAPHAKSVAVEVPSSRVATDILGRAGTILLRLAKPIAVLVLLVIIWQVYTSWAHVNPLVLPAPKAVWHELAHDPGLFWRNGLATLAIATAGFAISLVFGVTAAVVMTRFRFMKETFLPLAVTSQVIPTVAIAPLLVIWMGFGEAPRITVAFLISFFPILINTVAGLEQVQQPYYDLADSLGASRLTRFRKIEFPHALPFIFAGAKLGVTLAVIGAVIGEFVNASSGLGFLVLQGSSQLQTALMIAALVCLAIMGLVMFNLVRLVEYIALPWERGSR
jgi:NitT/TauT family transport system permease protein